MTRRPPSRRTRFERQAKMVATLEHPDICSLYDIGSHEGSLFLAMEHLSGETLAERLRSGALRGLPQRGSPGAPADRWQSARDIVLHLTSLQPTGVPSAVMRRSNPWALAAGFALCAVVSALGVDLWWRNTVRVPKEPLKRVSLTLPAGMQLAPNESPAAGASWPSHPTA